MATNPARNIRAENKSNGYFQPYSGLDANLAQSTRTESKSIKHIKLKSPRPVWTVQITSGSSSTYCMFKKSVWSNLLKMYCNSRDFLSVRWLPKKSCPFQYSQLIYENGQDFLDIQYLSNRLCSNLSGLSHDDLHWLSPGSEVGQDKHWNLHCKLVILNIFIPWLFNVEWKENLYLILLYNFWSWTTEWVRSKSTWTTAVRRICAYFWLTQHTCST